MLLLTPNFWLLATFSHLYLFTLTYLQIVEGRKGKRQQVKK
jgi:hypothetical protein